MRAEKIVSAPAPTSVPWTFLSNHAHVLICLAQDPEMRLRDVSTRVGITERGVQKILKDLEQAHVLSRFREGRRNRYKLHIDRPLRHPIESHRSIAHLLQAVLTIEQFRTLPRR